MEKGIKDNKVRKERFSKIFQFKQWGTGTDITYAGSVASGPGSTLNYAQEAMATLHNVIDNIKQQYGLKTIRLLDCPCGDFQWMFRFLRTRDDVIYTGVDIVPDLIKRHKNKFRSNTDWRFLVHDMVQSRLNDSYDLILVRHVLQHLPNNDILRMLSHLSDGGNRYLLATTFPLTASNTDLKVPGGYRMSNLQLEPLLLSAPLCFHDDGLAVTGGFLGLWKLPLTRITACSQQKEYKFKGYTFHACG